MHTHTRKKSGAFTLVELLVVISIIAIIAALVIGKFSGVTESASDAINLANLGRISSAVESYSLLNERGFNRLDIVVRGTASGMTSTPATGTAGSFSTSTDALLVFTNSLKNTGLDLAVSAPVTAYGTTFPPLLTQYFLSDADAAALKDIGMTYVMRNTTGGRMETGDDKEWGTGSVDDPDTVVSIATTLAPGLAVTAVNPAAISGGGSTITPLGTTIYQSCGQDVRFTLNGSAYGISIDGTSYSDFGATEAMMNALKGSGAGGPTAASAKGGLLLAFGLGQYASLIGSNKAGLDSAPICPIMKETQYRRYFLLFRLQTVAGVTKAEFAGVMDSKGNTAKQLRAAAKK